MNFVDSIVERKYGQGRKTWSCSFKSKLLFQKYIEFVRKRFFKLFFLKGAYLGIDSEDDSTVSSILGHFNRISFFLSISSLLFDHTEKHSIFKVRIKIPSAVFCFVFEERKNPSVLI